MIQPFPGDGDNSQSDGHDPHAVTRADYHHGREQNQRQQHAFDQAAELQALKERRDDKHQHERDEKLDHRNTPAAQFCVALRYRFRAHGLSRRNGRGRSLILPRVVKAFTPREREPRHTRPGNRRKPAGSRHRCPHNMSGRRPPPVRRQPVWRSRDNPPRHCPRGP